MKKQVSITAAMMILFFLCAQASAGSSSRRRLEGFLIGTGVTILGASVIGMLKDNDRDRKHACSKPKKKYQRKKRFHDQRPRSFHIPPPHRGRPDSVYAAYNQGQSVIDLRQEKQKVWADPVYEQVWIPGYFNKRHQWVEGYHDTVIVKKY